MARTSDAPGSAAGLIFQLERALYHLAGAGRNAFVAVEYVDDVAVIEADGAVALREQDKHSIRRNAETLGDRSLALWRTLQIWLTSADDENCRRYILATNKPVTAPIASMLKALGARADSAPSARKIVVALRAAGNPKPRRKSRVQAIADDVLRRSDDDLVKLVSRIEIIEARNDRSDQEELADLLNLDPRLDPSRVVEALIGWMTTTLQAAWRLGHRGLISRAAYLKQRSEIERDLARRRFLPKPARDVRVGPQDRDQAMTRPFVHHLARIEADEDDVLQAVNHFIQFNIEKHRLTTDGEVRDGEWLDRGERLRQRWLNVVRQTKRELRGSKPEEVGVRILERSTYEHLEPLGADPCNELYMTSGHYHRLADEDSVWWHPDYRPKLEG